MTARELIIQTPQGNESNEAYFRRLAALSGKSETSIKSTYYKIKRKFIVTQQKFNGKGQLLSTTEKLQTTKMLLPPEHLEVSRVSTNESTGQQWVIHTKESEKKALFELNKETIKQSIQELNLKPLEVPKIKPKWDKVLKITYTDVHVGMHIENDLYDSGFWGEDELNETLKNIVQHCVIAFENHYKIVVEDLGDLVDGWNGETTRGGHKLPQNMSNTECFKAATRFKIELAKELSLLGVPLEFHNVVNDNHGGDFSHLVNLHVKEVLSYLLPDVEYNIYTDFISHYIVGEWAFIICHGKDAKFMKFGFKAQLDQKAKDHISNYIDKHDLHSYKICFEKGDSHQLIRDCSNPKFEYNSYMALSPSSEWVSTNFSKGRRGFAIEEINGHLKTFTSIEL
jgi:hypothetical protein